MSAFTILGASGFIGSALARAVKEAKLAAITPDRTEKLTGKNLGHVIYCIGLTADFRTHPLETIEAHVCHLLHILRDCDFDSLVYLSSSRVYRNQAGAANEEASLTVNPLSPDDLYNLSKIMGEAAALTCGDKAKIVRLSNVYGPDFTSENFLAAILKQAVTQNHVTLYTSPDSEKDYVSIHDVVEGLLKITMEGKERIYNLASGTNVSNHDLVTRISELTGCRITFDPTAPRRVFPPIPIDRMRAEFSFAPRNLLEDLGELVTSYQKHDRAGKVEGKE